MVRVQKRRRRNALLRIVGGSSIVLCLLFLLYIIFNICNNCYYALMKVEILVPINVTNDDTADFRSIIENSLEKVIFDKTNDIISGSASWLVANLVKDKSLVVDREVALWLPASSVFSNIVKHNKESKIKDKLNSLGMIKTSFNTNIFIHADSQYPEYAGVLGALIGSLFTILICCVCALPIGILAGISLQEFKVKNKIIASIIEISINNLSATPAIIFGIVGLYFFISVLGIPRSSALVGGLVLSLMMLPILVISTRQALSTIPNGIKEAAFALGASRLQVVLHHSLPIAFPNILTGVILGVSRVLAESAPLLMVGMAAFVADVPKNILEPATVFPLQIYIWANNPDNGFAELNSVLMLVLLVILLTLNIIATIVRRKANHMQNC